MITVDVKNRQNMGFTEAYSLAREKAKNYFRDPMALSWLNRQTGRYSPDIDYCHEEGKESWEIYGESRGGTLRIEIGDKYAFIFREGIN